MRRKVGKGDGKRGCSRPLCCERIGRAGRGKVMDGKELFCLRGMCICGNKEMFMELTEKLQVH
jgi:hypothetical protein